MANHLLPELTETSRSRLFLKLWVWGCGEDGSLGLGPDHPPKEGHVGNCRKFAHPAPWQRWKGLVLRQQRHGALGREPEFGLSLDELISRPRIIPALKPQKALSIHGGNVLSAAVTGAGESFVWGAIRDSKGPIILPNGQHFSQAPTKPFDPISSVACGESHILVVATGGALYDWGSNEGHQFGTASLSANVVGPPVTASSRGLCRGWGLHSFVIDSIGDVWG